MEKETVGKINKSQEEGWEERVAIGEDDVAELEMHTGGLNIPGDSSDSGSDADSDDESSSSGDKKKKKKKRKSASAKKKDKSKKKQKHADDRLEEEHQLEVRSYTVHVVNLDLHKTYKRSGSPGQAMENADSVMNEVLKVQARLEVTAGKLEKISGCKAAEFLGYIFCLQLVPPCSWDD